MSIIFGVFARGDAHIPEGWAAAMAAASEKFPCDHAGLVSSGRAFMGCRQHYNTPQSSLVKQPSHVGDANVQLLFDGRLDNREALAATLNVPLGVDTTDEELILHGYQMFGSDLVEHLLGDFAIAVYDAEK